MKEKDYIKATNRVKVTMALTILRDVLPGDEYGVSASELVNIRRPLRELEERLFSSFDIEEESEP